MKRFLFSKNYALQVLLVLFYLLPFIFIIIYDQLILHRHYYSTPTDTLPSYFGMGLNWLTLRPKFIFHHPGYFFHQLSGLLIKITGVNVDNLLNFNTAGMVVNIVVLTFTAWWLARLSKKLSFGPVSLLLVGLLTSLMPTIILSSTLWSAYFSLSILAVPICLEIYNIAINRQNNFRSVFLVLFCLGFVVGNLTLSLFLSVGILIALLAVMGFKQPVKIDDKLGFRITGRYFSGSVRSLLLIIFSLVISCNIGFLISHLVLPFSNSLSRYLSDLLIGVVAIIIACFTMFLLVFSKIIKKYLMVDRVFYLIISPFFLGWLLATNVMFSFYGISAWEAFITKGGAAVGLGKATINSFLSGINGFFSHSSWHWFLVLGALFCLFIAYRAYRSRKAEDVFVALFCILGLFLNIIVAAKISFLVAIPNWYGVRNFGQVSRYFLFAPAVLSVMIVYVRRNFRTRCFIVAAVLVLIISFLSFKQYARGFSSVVNMWNAANTELAELIDEYLAKEPNGTVVCARTALPEYCALLYGYNTYRTSWSKNVSKRESIKGGRIIYRETKEIILSNIIASFHLNNGNKYLVITELSDRFADTDAELIWKNSNLYLGAYLVK